MKRLLALTVLTVLAIGGLWWYQAGAEERTVSQVLADVQAAALAGLSRRDPAALDGYFATEAEGALAAGLAETREAYQDFATSLPRSSVVQFHSFEIQALEVHREAGLVKATYRLHFSVVRSGQAIFSARVTQDLALLKTSRGWQIMGGDAPRLEDVIGNWPPR